jgi:hypothetical protein
MLYKILSRSFLLIGLFISASFVYALPALQLGPDDPNNADWNYDIVTETWVLGGFGGISAFANALSGEGDYAWDTGDTSLTAYLSIAGVPKSDEDAGPVFDVSITGSTGISRVDWGFGSPPTGGGRDNEDIAAHGIFDTYFEVYEFVFDIADIVAIYNTQPDASGNVDTSTHDGYAETFNVTLNWILDGVEGLHFDLFTIEGVGEYNRLTSVVRDIAPYSHDAEMKVPEPGSLLLLGLGILGLFSSRRAKLLM